MRVSFDFNDSEGAIQVGLNYLQQLAAAICRVTTCARRIIPDRPTRRNLEAHLDRAAINRRRGSLPAYCTGYFQPPPVILHWHAELLEQLHTYHIADCGNTSWRSRFTHRFTTHGAAKGVACVRSASIGLPRILIIGDRPKLYLVQFTVNVRCGFVV